LIARIIRLLLLSLPLLRDLVRRRMRSVREHRRRYFNIINNSITFVYLYYAFNGRNRFLSAPIACVFISLSVR